MVSVFDGHEKSSFEELIEPPSTMAFSARSLLTGPDAEVLGRLSEDQGIELASDMAMLDELMISEILADDSAHMRSQLIDAVEAAKSASAGWGANMAAEMEKSIDCSSLPEVSAQDGAASFGPLRGYGGVSPNMLGAPGTSFASTTKFSLLQTTEF